MVSSAAKIAAAQRMELIEARLLPFEVPQAVDAEVVPESNLGQRVAARLIEREHHDRHGRTPLRPIEARFIAHDLVGLEWRAVQAEVALGRLRARRLVRLLGVFAGWRREPWRLGRLVRGLAAAFDKQVLPELPDPPSAEGFLAELEEVTTPVKPRRRPAYPHLRVAHAGRITMFEMVAPHFRLGEIDLDHELTTGFDMLLIEPGVDDPLDEVDPEVLSRFRDAEIPILYVARTSHDLSHSLLTQVDLVIVEEPDSAAQAENQGLAILQIHPSVDDTIHNPVGWKQHPDPSVMVIADHSGIEDHIATIAPHADLIHLYGAEIPGFTTAQQTPLRPVAAAQNRAAKNHLAAYTTPQLTSTPTSHTQLVLELVAAGLPVITPPDPTLTNLLKHHYLAATSHEELAAHIQTLQHQPSRERHSIPARRHVLTNHTRRHRFEQLLTHLGIPTNPTPRISILLATKRPDQIDHALENVTKQTWDNKELLLILHGPENFDLDHITNLAGGRPYPTQIITCPATWTLGDILNAGLDQATGAYITKMDDDDHYGPNHLTDLITAHTYSNADITGKWGNIVHLVESDITLDWQTPQEERFGTHIPGATMFIQRELAAKYRFARVRRAVDSTLWSRMRADGLRLYSTHRYNFIRVRHTGHTYSREDVAFISTSGPNARRGFDSESTTL